MRGDLVAAADAAGRVGMGVLADIIQRLDAQGRESRNGEDGHHGRNDLPNAVLHRHVLVVPEVEDAIISSLSDPINADVHAKLEAFARG
jgi:hypothetical protein